MSTWMILRGVKTCMTGTIAEPERNKNALPRVTHNSGGAGAPEQAYTSGGGPHSSSSPVERDLISFGGPAEAAELANELQGGCADFPVRGWRFEVMQCLDALAHFVSSFPEYPAALVQAHLGAQPAG